MFFAGDSAGHCLPLTAEGIRTALYFGLACARELRSVHAGSHHARAGARALRCVLGRARAQIRLALARTARGRSTHAHARSDAALARPGVAPVRRWAFDALPGHRPAVVRRRGSACIAPPLLRRPSGDPGGNLRLQLRLRLRLRRPCAAAAWRCSRPPAPSGWPRRALAQGDLGEQARGRDHVAGEEHPVAAVHRGAVAPGLAGHVQRARTRVHHLTPAPGLPLAPVDQRSVEQRARAAGRPDRRSRPGGSASAPGSDHALAGAIAGSEVE